MSNIVESYQKLFEEVGVVNNQYQQYSWFSEVLQIALNSLPPDSRDAMFVKMSNSDSIFRKAAKMNIRRSYIINNYDQFFEAISEAIPYSASIYFQPPGCGRNEFVNGRSVLGFIITCGQITYPDSFLLESLKASSHKHLNILYEIDIFSLVNARIPSIDPLTAENEALLRVWILYAMSLTSLETVVILLVLLWEVETVLTVEQFIKLFEEVSKKSADMPLSWVLETLDIESL